MNRPLVKRIFPQVLAWTALVVLCGALALAQDTVPSPATATRTDGQIEMDVVHALDASNALKQDLITAATIQSEVTLSGTVSDEASRELAESIASHVPGVTKVNNNLNVGNPQNAPAAQDSANSAQDSANSGDQQMADSQPGGADQPAPVPPPAPADGPLPVPNQPQDQPQAQTPPPPPARPQYAPQYPQYPPRRPPVQAYDEPKGPVTVPQGTLLQLRTIEPVNSKKAKAGTAVEFQVIQDVAIGNVLAIPRGATVHGVVTEAKKAGDLAGSPELALTLTSLELGGQSYPLDTNQFKVKGPGKGAQTAHDVIGAGLLGTMIGCIAGRGVGCAIGAGAGVATGTAVAAASPGPGVWIPAEAKVDFHLKTPVTITPVSLREAARLAQGLYPGGPTLYRRGYYPYGQPYYGGYPYGYPPPYYRPYYIDGGYYYWR